MKWTIVLVVIWNTRRCIRTTCTMCDCIFFTTVSSRKQQKDENCKFGIFFWI